MYVAPTPFAVVQGLTGTRTLLVPASWKPPRGFKSVGNVIRVEAPQLVVGYEFDLKTNEIAAKTIPNPSAGRKHRFVAYRIASDSDKPVMLIADFHPEGSKDEDY